jgi:RNA polymerase sigma-70 factor (ECF subfamily)
LKERVHAQAQAAELDRERAAIERAQAGDPRALEPVLAAHAEALYATVIVPRLGDRALAEDVLRDTFVTAIEKIGAYEFRERSVYFWLRRIALHRLIDVCRRQGRARRAIAALEAEAAEAAVVLPGADEALIAEEDRRRATARIEAALERLPERYARAIRLRLVEERTREASAAALAVSVGNFDVILFRAVRAFRRIYGDRE